MSGPSRPWHLNRLLSLATIVGMLLALSGYLAVPDASAAVGAIYPITGTGASKNAYVSEYPGTNRLYALSSEVAGDGLGLKLTESANPDGSAWNTPQNVPQYGTKPNFPRIQLAADGAGRLHGAWSDDAFGGAVYHAWFTPGPGKSPANPSQWQYETVSGSGKDVAFDIDPAGNVYFVWDTGEASLIRRWSVGSGSLGNTSTFRGASRTPGIAATSDGRLHTIYVDTNDKFTYYRPLNTDFSGAEPEQRLADGRADDIPQITKDSANNVHMAWTQQSNLNGAGAWEIFYARRLAGQALQSKERVSINYTSGTDVINHGRPTVKTDANGTPWVAWHGGETGGKVRQIYERKRGADGNPWPYYGDAGSVCVSCNNGGDAQNPRYGASSSGAIHLTFVQKDNASGGVQRVQYSLRQAGGANLSFSSSRLDFGPQQFGTTSAKQVVTGTNTGVGATIVTGVAVTGPDAGAFTITDNNCATVQPTQGCQVGVTFTAMTGRNQSANLTFTYAGGATQTVALYGAGTPPTPTVAPNQQFYLLDTPVRLLDTRSFGAACDPYKGALGAGTTRPQSTQFPTCLPVPANATAIVGNATVIAGQGGNDGYITLYSGAYRPDASSLNYTPGQTRPNAFTIGLSGGQFNIYTSETVDFIVDVVGYYLPLQVSNGPTAAVQGNLYFHRLAEPRRLLDTRPGFGACDGDKGALPGGVTRTQGLCGLVPRDAVAIVGNATVVNNVAPADGYLTLFPSGNTPLVSNLNYKPNQYAVANAFTVGLSDGTFRISSTQTVNFIVDIAGYYSTSTTDANGPGLLFNAVSYPIRLVDTRPGFTTCIARNAPLAEQSPVAFQARGTCFGFTPSQSARAFVFNVTAVNPATGGGGFLTLWPNEGNVPNVSNVNYEPGQIVPNAAVVGVKTADPDAGSFAIQAFTGGVHVVIDYSGYFDTAGRP